MTDLRVPRRRGDRATRTNGSSAPVSAPRPAGDPTLLAPEAAPARTEVKEVERAPVPGDGRPVAAGKFITVAGTKLYLRGVTYGAFAPAADGLPFPPRDVVAADLAKMAEAGVNAVRVYDAPPVWLLDLAAEAGLWVMVGLAWDQRTAKLGSRGQRRTIERSVRAGVRAVAGHRAILAYSVGNEIPPSIIRWHGHRFLEAFIGRLAAIVREEDPGALVSYANYLTTDFLRLPTLDFVSFNVHLEDPERHESYLARLQSLAGDRPLVVTEIGLDSKRHGTDEQAASIGWQIPSVFRGGAAGAFVFAWTDDWYRDGHAIDDWDFGMTDRERSPKPALDAMRRAFAEVPFPARAWPRISVVVCTYNGSRTIRDCLEGLMRLEYPNAELIVVNDGSTDGTEAIVREYDVRLISTPNMGLSSARNTGLEAATGGIVAYTDDDARPDPHWLHYLADAFMRYPFAAVGGPNIAPPGDGPIADCVANAPGGPVQVLLTDTIAEHIPGCNMAFRRDRLLAVGGFDVQYRTAGDDVDACWRIEDAGGTIGFAPAAMVWHHRRNSVSMFWRQQNGYGRAEAMLERKWPARYNALGHLRWAGRLYGKGLTAIVGRGRERVKGGVWGSSAHHQLVEAPVGWTIYGLMPEWYLVIGALAGLTALGASWRPLLGFALPLAIATGLLLGQALVSARRASFTSRPRGRRALAGLYLLTFGLHLLQPLARLRGRIRHGLSFWRIRGRSRWTLPRPRRVEHWIEEWRPAEARLEALEGSFLATDGITLRGGIVDDWDLEVRVGLLASVRLLAVVEEHGAGRQLTRYRAWPRVPRLVFLSIVAGALLAAGAAVSGALLAGAALALLTALLVVRVLVELGLAMGIVRNGFDQLPGWRLPVRTPR